MKNQTAVVIGGGAFGTSIASILSENFKDVIILVRSQDVYDSILAGENSVYLPGHKLAENISAALNWDELYTKISKESVDLIVNGLPTGAIKPYFSSVKTEVGELLKLKTPLVSLSKGIDPETLELSDDLFHAIYPEYMDNIVFLSGPSFAKEILEKQVTIVTIAGKLPDVLLDVANKLATNYFKAIPTYDVKGVLLGGALKNILAIAGGILEGLGYNHNTTAAMITRGINEMLRFGKVFNARPETFYSFSGMGDLILTTTSSLSRNKSFGLKLVESELDPREIIDSQRSVVEGYKTTQAAYELAQKYHIRAPMFEGIYQILYKGVKPQKVLTALMKLPITNID